MKIPLKRTIIFGGFVIAVLSLGIILWPHTHRSFNGAETKSFRKAGQEIKAQQLQASDFPSPVKGRLLRSIGRYYSQTLKTYVFHYGKDYAEPEGAVIRTLHGGTVIFSGFDPILGSKVEINCGEGWQVTYGCLENLQVRKNQVVEPLCALGQVGSDCGADNCAGVTHLHYEVRHNGELQPLN